MKEKCIKNQYRNHGSSVFVGIGIWEKTETMESVLLLVEEYGKKD